MNPRHYAWTELDQSHLQRHPIENAATIPSHWFTNPALFQDELQNLLRSHWQYVGHESQIPMTGDLIADDVLGVPLLVIRSADQTLRAMANVCRHRGGPLVKTRGIHRQRQLTCAYHAWSYNLEGQLLRAPKFEPRIKTDHDACSLPQFPVAIYSGLIFVRLNTDSPSPENSVDQWLSGIQERIAPIAISTMRFSRRVVYDVACNWKVYVDNYMEGYHIKPVHPGLSDILDLKGYTTSIDATKVLQYGPLTGADNPYHTDGAAYYYHVFPNLMLNILPGRMQVNAIVPVSVDRCQTIFDFYYDEPNAEKLTKKVQDDLEVSDLVQKEDIEICEHVQRGLQSGTYLCGRICPSEELGVFAFHNQLREAYGKIFSGGH
jgi:choline monooxygenase